MTKVWLICLAVALACAPAGFAQKQKEAPTRNVSGVVTTSDGTLVVGAVVQLKDTKTKQVRSFYTQSHGEYYFRGLSPDVEYELSAQYNGANSNTRTLSVFDSRRDAVVDLKLNDKK